MLSEAYQRKLAAAAHLVADSPGRIRCLLEAGRGSGSWAMPRPSLMEDDVAALKQRVEAASSSITGLIQKFSLEDQPLDLGQGVRAELSAIWTMLESCRPSRMESGSVRDAEMEKYLEKALDDLVVGIVTMRAKLP